MDYFTTVDVEGAKVALRDAVPDINAYFEKGQIEIIPHNDWYSRDNKLNPDIVLNRWIVKTRCRHEQVDMMV